MSGQLNRFYIHGLWGEKDVDLRFENNRLIMVGENGSGKTTILRIIYETLACKWALLSVEDFVCIELWFGACNNPIIIKKMRIQSAKELFINSNSDIIQELPPIQTSSSIIVCLGLQKPCWIIGISNLFVS